MGILKNINSPEDVKKLDISKLDTLAREIRSFLIESVSHTGGHLASNLGVVELTIALHRCFNTPEDKIVWDVGHQSYVHKILTGRQNDFEHLRTYGGISGFPKIDENIHDSFNTGHSSTSVSAALGFAKARDIKGEKYYAVAVIGDGSLTGGLAYEALNNAGRIPSNFIVVLNDNGMSISQNVGAMSKYLSKARLNPSYSKAKYKLENILNKIPNIGEKLSDTLKKTKDEVRDFLVDGSIFTDLGFNYYGNIDGHNIEELISAFDKAKKVDGPVLLHVITKKGNGYSYAEKSPDVFHGIGKFDADTGIPDKSTKKACSKTFGDTMIELASENNKIVAITAAMPSGTGLVDFAKKYKNNFFDVGIAEEHAVTFSAALALGGITPVVAIYSTFLQRAYDQIIHDVALQNQHVVFALDRSGLVGEDGETHHGIFDISYLSTIPNMSILAPSNHKLLEEMIKYSVDKHNAPIALRYPKALPDDDTADFEFGKAHIVQEGTDITLVSVGSMLEIAKKAALLSGKSVEIIDLRTVKPFDKATIKASFDKTGKIAVLEDNMIVGGVGMQIESEIGVPVLKFGHKYIPSHGSLDELYKECGLDEKSIADAIIGECSK